MMRHKLRISEIASRLSFCKEFIGLSQIKLDLHNSRSDKVIDISKKRNGKLIAR